MYSRIDCYVMNGQSKNYVNLSDECNMLSGNKVERNKLPLSLDEVKERTELFLVRR